MKKYLLLIVTSLLMMACSDGVKDEAVGMFLLPGINYGDDVQELIDNGVVQLKHLSPEGKYYALNATVYGYDFSNDALGVKVENKKIIDILFGVKIPYDIYVGDTMPSAIKMAMQLEEELTAKLGIPTKIEKLHYAYKTMQTIIQWNKNGLKYELSTCPGPQNMFLEINYSVESSKDDV